MRYDVTTGPDRGFANVEWRNAVQRGFEVPALVRLLRLPRGGDVLEVGCGRGVALRALERKLEPRTLTGIDVDALLVAEAGARSSARTLVADVRRLPFAGETFDLVIDFGTLHHIVRPEEALREVERVLRVDGMLVHETRLAQLVAHPGRFTGAPLPWGEARRLRPRRTAGFWATRRKHA